MEVSFLPTRWMILSSWSSTSTGRSEEAAGAGRPPRLGTGPGDHQAMEEDL